MRNDQADDRRCALGYANCTEEDSLYIQNRNDAGALVRVLAWIRSGSVL